MNIRSRLRTALLEAEDKDLTDTDNKVLRFILGEELSEADSSDIIKRFIDVINSKQRRFITSAVITALLATPNFTHALNKAPDETKQRIEKFLGTTSDQASESQSSNAEFSLNLNNTFKSGSYQIDKNEIAGKLASLKEFLTKNKTSSFKIKITASESRVPNQDNLKTGELSKLRAQVMEKTVSDFINSNNLGNIKIEQDLRVGDVPWDGLNRNDNKYVKDQFVKLEVFIVAATGCDISFSKEDGSMSDAKHGYVSYEQTIQDSGILRIKPGSIPDRLIVMSNENIISDTGYFVDSPHNYKEWNLVPLYVAELTEILASNPNAPAIKNLKTLKSFSDFKQLIDYMLKDKNFDIRKDNRAEIKNGLNKLKALWDSGQREFVLYVQNNQPLKYEIPEGQKGQVIVYSPVGKTGFSLKGQCQ